MHVLYDSGGSEEIVLQDVPTTQTFALKGRNVTKVALDITLVYHSAKGHNVAVTQVEFFTRS